jgi:hypothetical protein
MYVLFRPSFNVGDCFIPCWAFWPLSSIVSVTKCTISTDLTSCWCATFGPSVSLFNWSIIRSWINPLARVTRCTFDCLPGSFVGILLGSRWCRFKKLTRFFKFRRSRPGWSISQPAYQLAYKLVY